MPSRTLSLPRSALLYTLLLAGVLSPRAGFGQESPSPDKSSDTPPHDTPRISGFDIHGSIDPKGQIERFVLRLIPTGSYFVEEGEADREGLPIGTAARLRRALDSVGYHAVVEPEPAGAMPAGQRGVASRQVRVSIHLRAYDRVRHIFVAGNRRLRQEEILRRISIRPGQALPLVGPERDALVERERLSVRDFLRSQGYLEAEPSLELHPEEGIPASVNILVQIRLGPGYPLGPITVAGNRALRFEEIANSFRHLDWQWAWSRPLPFNQSVLREDLAKVTELYREMGYPGARISHRHEIDYDKKHIRLHLQVNERKRIEVAFEGNRRRRDGTLREVLTIFSRGAYDDHEARESAAAIAQHYRERGHMLVRVTWRRERLSSDVDRIVFVVEEGPSLRVREVSFAGNRIIPSSTLTTWVTVKVFPPLGALGLGAGGYASLRQLALDVENLGIYYRRVGFPEAQIRCEIAPDSKRWRPLASVRPENHPEWRGAKDLHVRFFVDEGPRVTVQTIRFEVVGESVPLPRDETFLRESLLSRVEAPYRPDLVREDGSRLQRVLQDEGYSQASAEPVITRTADRAHVVWQLKLGPRVRVGEIFVRGNFITREGTVREWIPLRTGSLLTTTGLERGQRNLALIQLFGNPNPIRFPIDEPTAPDAPMLIQVEERHDHWGVARVGGGASTEQVTPGGDFPLGVYASAGYEHRNLFGQGWTIVSHAAYGNSLTRGTASFIDPRFFGTLFRLELSGNYLRQATVRLGDIRSGGGSIGFAREMYPGLDAAVRYSVRETTRTEFLLRGAGSDLEQKTVEIGTLVGSVGLHLEWLRLDNPLVPTRGFKISAGLELADPSLSFARGQDAFVKLGLRSLVVVPLTAWLSLRHSVRYDHGFPFGAPLLPKVERFFAGGDTTIRGFELDRARSEIVRFPLAPEVFAVQYRPLGGNLRLLQNFELQFPIASPLHGALFFDSGVVSDSFNGLSARHFRHSVGISPLLIKLPVGDVSLSWAWPLDPGPGDSRAGRLHFNVGLMF